MTIGRACETRVRDDGDVHEQQVSFQVGDASVSGIATSPDSPSATVVVAHGAGAGMEHPFLAGLTRALADEGLASLRFNFAYREAGRRFPDRPPAAIAAWRAAMVAAADLSDGPIWASGKSFGGRMASMAVAEGMEAAGLVYLGYPLHPPGKPDRLRDEHLPGVPVPQLFLQGTKDPFATGDLLDRVVARLDGATLEWLDGAGHSFEVAGVKRSQDEIGASLAPRIAAFVRAH